MSVDTPNLFAAGRTADGDRKAAPACGSWELRLRPGKPLASARHNCAGDSA